MSGPGFSLNAQDWIDAQDARDAAAQEAAEDEDSDTGEPNGDHEVSQQADLYGSSSTFYEW
jgi:hypothetical protein